MHKNKVEWIDIFFWIILIVLFTMVLTRVFGNSATDIQIYIAIITALAGIINYVAKHHREIGEIKIDMKHSFSKVRGDINRLEGKIDILLKKINDE